MTKKLPIILAFCASAVSLYSAANYELKKLRPSIEPAEDVEGFIQLSPESTGLTSPNVYNDPRMWGGLFRELTLGSLEAGVAIADYDKDGRLDIYSVSKNGPSSLYLQTIDYRFVDIARVAGVAADDSINGKQGATAIDINQDGWMDIYVCRYDAPNLLFVNNGDATFEERAAEYGIDVSDASVHASFADYDRDGDLDFYLVTNILDFSVSPQGSGDYLFRNEGDGTFKNVTRDSGIWGKTQGHTAIWFDSNQDGWPDIYVANDFETPDRFYLNKGDGTFIDVVDERLPHVTYFSMGADSGDLNNDGLIDYFVADMRDRTRAEFVTGMEEMGRGLWEMERVPELIPQYMWNALYLNAGNDRYKEMAHMAGLEATGWTWATRMGDFDNDGFLDVTFTTGMIRNFMDADLIDRQNVARTITGRAAVWKNAPMRSEPNLAFRNTGDLNFEDVSEKWGLNKVGVSFGCATADMDGDGDLDLVFSNYNEPPTFARNDMIGGNRFVVALKGRAPNLQGVGAEITIETKSGKQVRQLFGERGIVSSEPAAAFFGLGSDEEVDRLTVRWPLGQTSVLEDLPAGYRVEVMEPEIEKPILTPAVVETPRGEAALFVENAVGVGLDFSNELKPFDELSRQRNLPRRMNGQGPGLASGDVNGDGALDVFVTGAAGQSGALFLGKQGGQFVKSESQPWEDAAEADDVGAVFFDVNGDEALDLFVSVGGVRPNQGDRLLDDRLYLNDGHGGFTLADESVLGSDGEATGAIAVADIDADGDLDVFVGGRFTPGEWPKTPKSFLYENQGGKLVAAANKWAPGIDDIGMVTAAEFADLTGDGRPDLVLALEWGSVRCYVNDGSALKDETEALGLAGLTGWWSALKVADVNGDGLLDILAGNLGLNTKYHASQEAPTVIYVGDFNGDGRNHIVEAQYDQGELYPIRGRSKLAYSFPWLPEQFPTYHDYSKATIGDIFSEEQLSRVTRYEANELASGVFYQESDGTFRFERLPGEAQAGPIHTFAVSDMNGDGVVDVFCAGNNFGGEPSTGRFDGSLGTLLSGKKEGGFAPLWPNVSGISVPGEARASVLIPSEDGSESALLVARASGPLLYFVPAE